MLGRNVTLVAAGVLLWLPGSMGLALVFRLLIGCGCGGAFVAIAWV